MADGQQIDGPVIALRMDDREPVAVLRGIVRLGQESARQVQQQMQAAMAGIQLPRLDLKGFDQVRADIRREVDAIRAEVASGAPIAPPVGVPDGPLREGEQKIGTWLDRLGQRAQQAFFIRDAVGSFVRDISQSVRATAGPFMELESQLANVSSIMGEGGDAAALYRDDLLALVTTTGQSATQLGQALYEVVGAFGQTDDAMAIMEISARAATGGMMEAATAVDFVSAVSRGYNDVTTENIQTIFDLGQTAVNVGKVSFPQLAKSMGETIPLAVALKVRQEELFAVMGTATGVTGSASQVATQLKGAMQALMKPTEDVTKILEANGFASVDAAIGARGMVGTLQILAAAAEKSGTPIQDLIPSIEGTTLALALSGAQADQYAAALKAMDGAAGASAVAYDKNSQTLERSLANVRNQIEAFRIGAMTSSAGAATAFVDAVGAMLEQANELPGPLKTAALAFGALGQATIGLATTGLVPMLAYLPRVISMVRAAMTATWTWITAQRTLLSLTGAGLVVVLGSFAVAAASAAEASKHTGTEMAGMGNDAAGAAPQIDSLAASLSNLSKQDIAVRQSMLRGAQLVAQREVEEATRQANLAEGLASLTIDTAEAERQRRLAATYRAQADAARGRMVSATRTLDDLQREEQRRRATSTSPSVVAPDLSDPDKKTSAERAAEQRADRIAQLDRDLIELRARSVALQREAELAAISDVEERRRQEIDTTYTNAVAAAEAAHAAAMRYIVDERMAGDEATRARSVADQTRVNALAEAQQARAEAEAQRQRRLAEQTAQQATALREANDRLALAEMERQHAIRLAGITDEGDRRREEILSAETLAEETARRRYDSEMLRIDGLFATQAEKDAMRQQARIAYDTALSEADRRRIDATADAQREADEDRARRQKDLDDETARRRQEQAQQLEDYLNTAYRVVADALRQRQQISDVEAELQRDSYRRQEDDLRQSLAERRITQTQFALEMRRLAEEQSAYERRVEQDKASAMVRIGRGMINALINEFIRLAIAKAAMRLLDLALGSVSSAASGATGSGSIGNIVPTPGGVASLSPLGGGALTSAGLLRAAGLSAYAGGGVPIGLRLPDAAGAPARPATIDLSPLLAANERQTFETKQMRADLARLQDVARQPPLSPRTERRRLLAAHQEQQRLDPTMRR